MSDWALMRGWCGFAAAYDRMVGRANDGDTIVEIGVAFGKSLAYLGRRVIDSGKKIHVVGVDPFIDDWGTDRPTWGAEHAEWAREQGGPFNSFFASMREHARMELELAQVWRMRSEDAYVLLSERKYLNRIAGILIDGDHGYEACAFDISKARELVAPHGILAGDDYSTNFPGVQRAVHEAFGDDFTVEGTTWYEGKI